MRSKAVSLWRKSDVFSFKWKQVHNITIYELLILRTLLANCFVILHHLSSILRLKIRQDMRGYLILLFYQARIVLRRPLSFSIDTYLDHVSDLPATYLHRHLHLQKSSYPSHVSFLLWNVQNSSLHLYTCNYLLLTIIPIWWYHRINLHYGDEEFLFLVHCHWKCLWRYLHFYRWWLLSQKHILGWNFLSRLKDRFWIDLDHEVFLIENVLSRLNFIFLENLCLAICLWPIIPSKK